jgi:predicted exporter
VTARLATASAIALVLGVYCALQLRVGTDLTNFMPIGSRSELARISTRLTDSPFTRTMVISVGAVPPAAGRRHAEGDETERAVAVASALADSLRGHPEVAWVRSAVEETEFEDLYELYFPRRYSFLSEEPEREIPKLLSEDALRERARDLRRRLGSPASTFLERLATSDPIAAFERIARRFRAADPALKVVRGQFVTSDGRFAIILLGTRTSAFDSGAQARLLDDLHASFETLAAEHGGGVRLELSGANRFAVAAERAMKRDVWVISAFAFVGVATLFLLFVASLRGFLVVTVPPLAGVLVATAATLAVFGDVDGLTMVFGASLMGIAIDYSNHVLIHHGLAVPPETPRETALRIRPSLVIGALTTIASFAGMALTAFPAFRQMSFFAGVGVLAALLVSLWVLPDLIRLAPPLPSRSARAALAMGHFLERVSRLPRGVLLLPAGAAALSLLAIPHLEWSDDMSRLTRFDPEFIAEDVRVRQRVSQFETTRFVIGIAPDEAAAVALEDRIHLRLSRAAADGALERTRSLHDLLWSEELQRRNQAVVAADTGLARRVDAVFSAEGFRPGAFAAFADDLAAPPPAPLTLGDLRASPLADLIVPYVFPLGDQVAVVTYLDGLESPDAVRAALADLDGVYLLDQRTFVSNIYREFRETTLRQMLVGGVLVVLLLVARYRRARPVLASFLPSLVVAALVLALLSLTGVEANLLHVMSLIMVMGMGVDYGVFLVDSAGRRESVGATMLSLLMSCLTTAFVFGTLAFSSQPALRAIGVTTAVGILLSYALAPVALAAAGIRIEGNEE